LVHVADASDRQAQGIAPRLVAVVGANATFAFLALPRVALPLWAEALSVRLVLLGTLGSICAAVNLGRAFSILPQARQFVTSGTYRLVRHPLYLAEQVATWGLMLQFVQPWSALIAIFSLAAQFPRMHYEETVLRRASPAYEYYALKTDRLIPGVY
jgi:protein-S-isoprenylcysteine O-methyltransferase Ste14